MLDLAYDIKTPRLKTAASGERFGHMQHYSENYSCEGQARFLQLNACIIKYRRNTRGPARSETLAGLRTVSSLDCDANGARHEGGYRIQCIPCVIVYSALAASSV